MVLWFVATAVAVVWKVFGDRNFDYRLLVVGSLLPDMIDIAGGQVRWAHSLVVSVGTLSAVMVASAGRKPWRKLLLPLPIGMLLHLVFDGVVANSELFWWPFLGSWGNAEVPAFERGWWGVVLEAIGAALAAWMWRRFGLSHGDRRARFVHTGRLIELGR
jgi:hypothetical protein